MGAAAAGALADPGRRPRDADRAAGSPVPACAASSLRSRAVACRRAARRAGPRLGPGARHRRRPAGRGRSRQGGGADDAGRPDRPRPVPRGHPRHAVPPRVEPSCTRPWARAPGSRRRSTTSATWPAVGGAARLAAHFVAAGPRVADEAREVLGGSPPRRRPRGSATRTPSDTTRTRCGWAPRNHGRVELLLALAAARDRAGDAPAARRQLSTTWPKRPGPPTDTTALARAALGTALPSAAGRAPTIASAPSCSPRPPTRLARIPAHARPGRQRWRCARGCSPRWPACTAMRSRPRSIRTPALPRREAVELAEYGRRPGRARGRAARRTRRRVGARQRRRAAADRSRPWRTRPGKLG